MMIGAGAGTHIAGYEEAMKMRDFEEFAEEVEEHLKAGAKMIMVESERLTEDLPPGRWRKDVIKRLVDRFGYKTFMFEASDPPVFKWYLTTLDVNLFIDHSQVVEFTAWRTRWGDEEIWKRKKVSYTGRVASHPTLGEDSNQIKPLRAMSGAGSGTLAHLWDGDLSICVVCRTMVLRPFRHPY